MNGWCVVELFGHVRLVGEVSEVEMFGTKMGRVDALNRDGSRVTQLFGGGSVYRITPTTEEAAREMMRPFEPYRLSLPRGLDVADPLDELDAEPDRDVDVLAPSPEPGPTEARA